jgi:hypothetical protein
MTNQPETPAGQTPETWISYVRGHRKPIAIALFVLTLVLAVVPGMLLLSVLPKQYGYEYAWNSVAVVTWAHVVALATLAAGLWILLARTEKLAGVDDLRILVLITGGLAGLATWILSLLLGYYWRATLLGGLESWQGKEWWQLWLCLLALIGGLALMFVSLLPARVAERSSATLRRMVYGYNAILGGLLVVAILLVANVLVYNYLPTSFDWTESSIYTLSDRSKNILQSLDKPTKIYVLVTAAAGDNFYREVQTLVTNCRAVNDKIQVEYVSPDSPADIPKVRDLINHYQLNAREGLLVVYGPEGKEEHQFITYNDLMTNITDSDRPGDKPRMMFKGEDALISALNSLEEGKTRAVIYFTQGNGEPDINDSGTGPNSQGMGVLRERLQKANYEVKGLQFTPVAGVGESSGPIVSSNKVPDDAVVVVIAGPRNPLPDFEIKALRDFMNRPGGEGDKKKGKLVALIGPVLDPTKKLVLTGVENFLSDYGVALGDNRILSLPNNVNRNDPLLVPTKANRRSNNPIAEMFARWGGYVAMPNARTVESRPTNPNPSMSRFSGESLFQAARGFCWAETNLRAEPSALVESIMNNEEELRKRFSPNAAELSVAVTVGEPQPPKENDPHAFMRPPEVRPRAVVFGSSDWALNQYTTEGSGRPNYDLFASSLSWLRERPSNIGLEPKKRPIYVLSNVDDDVVTRMRFLPVVVMLIGILGLGTGVWLVRRR